MRAHAVLVGLAMGLAFLAPQASAHTGEGAAVSGMLLVAPGLAEATAILGMAPGDTLEWTWSSASANLTAELVWQDAGGSTHRVGSGGLPYGRFEAPPSFAGARLEWANSGPTEAAVEWNWACSAAFWSSPALFLPAAIPFLLLGAALGAGRLVDSRAKRRGGTPKE